MKKAAIYIRVSTTEQAEEGFSVQAQKEKLINYCKVMEWIISDIYIDPGFTGSNLKRPAMQKLIAEIKNFDIVLVWKLDRLSRSQKDTLFLLEDVFLKNKVDLISLSESFDTSTAFGKASIGILSVFAQLERENIKERSKMGKKERAKNGLFHGGAFIPIGYDYKDSLLSVNEYEALQVKEIYKLYLQGNGINTIERLMQKYKHKYGKWNRESIARIIDSQLYTGKINYYSEFFSGKHEAIITEETFRKVKVMREKKYNSKSFQYNSLLAGIIFCGVCGARYFLKNDHGYRYYMCYSRAKANKHMVKSPDCKNTKYREADLDEMVKTQIYQLSSNKDYVKFSEKKKKDNSTEIKILQKTLKTLENKIDKLLELYQIETIPLGDIGKKLSEVYSEKQDIENQIKALEEKKEEEINQAELKKVITSINKKWEKNDLQEKRKLLSFLINRIIILGEEIKVEWAF